MCERVQLLSVVSIVWFFWVGHTSTRVMELRSRYIIEMWGGTESDLQCCNGGGRLAEMFTPALQSYLGNDSYY